jgi:hypothetical protein
VVAKRLGRGLQNLPHRFESGPRLHFFPSLFLGLELRHAAFLSVFVCLLAYVVHGLGTWNLVYRAHQGLEICRREKQVGEDIFGLDAALVFVVVAGRLK